MGVAKVRDADYSLMWIASCLPAIHSEPTFRKCDITGPIGNRYAADGG
jgi:hypothetical protein